MVVMITPVAFGSIGYKTYIIFAVMYVTPHVPSWFATTLKLTFIPSNAFMFPCVYFFFPETRLRSLEEMDDIFKKSSNVFNVVSNSLNEPHRYDKHGQLKMEFVDEILHHEVAGQTEKPGDSDRSAATGTDMKV